MDKSQGRTKDIEAGIGLPPYTDFIIEKSAINGPEDVKMFVERCYQQYGPNVVRHLSNKYPGLDNELVKDFSQATFERLTRHLQGDFKSPIYHPKQYLLRTAENVYYDYFRAEKRGPATTDIPEEYLAEIGEDDIEQWMDTTDLQEALKALTPQEREMVRLRYIEEWTYRRMGKRYKRWPVTISGNLKKVLDKLRKELSRV